MNGLEGGARRPLAIVSAMHEELAAIRDGVADAKSAVLAGRTFWTGNLHGHPVVLVLCGIGKVAAAATAVLLAERFRPSAVLFTGVAGGLHPRVHVGDVVVATQLLQHDMDASPIFPRYVVPGAGLSHFEADAALTAALQTAAAQALGAPSTASVHSGLIVSGDRFVATAAESQDLQRRLPDALAVEMEGAAFAQVCRDLALPLAVVRTISDRADDSAHVDFVRFLTTVASPLSAAIVRAWLEAVDESAVS